MPGRGACVSSFDMLFVNAGGNSWHAHGLSRATPRSEKHEASTHCIDRAGDGRIGICAISDATPNPHHGPRLNDQRISKGRPCFKRIRAERWWSANRCEAGHAKRQSCAHTPTSPLNLSPREPRAPTGAIGPIWTYRNRQATARSKAAVTEEPSCAEGTRPSIALLSSVGGSPFNPAPCRLAVSVALQNPPGAATGLQAITATSPASSLNFTQLSYAN